MDPDSCSEDTRMKGRSRPSATHDNPSATVAEMDVAFCKALLIALAVWVSILPHGPWHVLACCDRSPLPGAIGPCACPKAWHSNFFWGALASVVI